LLLVDLGRRKISGMNEYRGGEHQARSSHEEDALPLEGEGNDDNFVSSAKRTFDSISEGIMSIVNPFSSVASCCSVNPKEKKTAPLMRVQRSTASWTSTPGIQRRPPGHGMSEQLPARMPPPGMSARFSPLEDFHNQHQQRQGSWHHPTTNVHWDETRTSLSGGFYSIVENVSVPGYDAAAAAAPPSRGHHQHHHQQQRRNQGTATDYYRLDGQDENSQPVDQLSADRGGGWNHDDEQRQQKHVYQQRQRQHEHEQQQQQQKLEQPSGMFQNGSHLAEERKDSAGGLMSKDRRMTKLEAEERMFGMSLGSSKPPMTKLEAEERMFGMTQDDSMPSSPPPSIAPVLLSDTPPSVCSTDIKKAVWKETVPPYLSLSTFQSPTPRPLFKNFKICAEIFEASEGADTPLSVV
jgi:hypothetical protein